MSIRKTIMQVLDKHRDSMGPEDLSDAINAELERQHKTGIYPAHSAEMILRGGICASNATLVDALAKEVD